jgi:predicted Holliday junction resolvase-like endonuclease
MRVVTSSALVFRMSLLRDLKSQRTLLAECPSCNKPFRLIEAQLFDAQRRRLPTQALEHLEGLRSQLIEGRSKLRSAKTRAAENPRRIAKSVNIGKVVEKIAPSLPGFPARSSDCRTLFEPIDYVIFHGLSVTGSIDALTFVDVKSGNARLTNAQSQVRSLVECGKVSLVIAARPKEDK